VLRRQSQTDWAVRDGKFTSIRRFAAIVLLVSIASVGILLLSSKSNQTPSQIHAPSPGSISHEIYNSNTTRVIIPTSGPAAPYPSNITISGMPGAIQKLTVEILDVNHTHMADVNILLAGPNGQAVILMADTGGPSVLSCQLYF